MQSFDTETNDAMPPTALTKTFVVGGIDDLQPGTCISFELPGGDTLAVYNVDGEYYATGNFCPHKGALLSDGSLCGHVIECGLHGWQFDVRSGECLTVPEKIRTYRVWVEDRLVKIEVTADSV
jgi:nitrite reductase/ring-hydroxylating ferredoxin subunit